MESDRNQAAFEDSVRRVLRQHNDLGASDRGGGSPSRTDRALESLINSLLETNQVGAVEQFRYNAS